MSGMRACSKFNEVLFTVVSAYNPEVSPMLIAIRIQTKKLEKICEIKTRISLEFRVLYEPTCNLFPNSEIIWQRIPRDNSD